MAAAAPKKELRPAQDHAEPPVDAECMICMEDLTADGYVEYRVRDGWLPCLFCVDCTEHLLKTQWHLYASQLAKASCKAEQRRLLDRGPPITIYDRNAMPCPDGQTVEELWYARDRQCHSAQLDGALTGEERQKWWDEKLAFKFEEDDAEEAAAESTAA